jgi:iron-sulfur cluster assembly accessory protein
MNTDDSSPTMPEAAQTETEAAIEITERAARRLEEEMVSTEGDVAGLRLLVQPGDCGLRYGLSFARDGAQDSEVSVSSNDVEVYIDEDALPFVEGATVDFQQTMLGEGFAIDNPNEMEGDCGSGCGCR